MSQTTIQPRSQPRSRPPLRPLPPGRMGINRPEACLKIVAAGILAAFGGNSPVPALNRYASQAVIDRLERQATISRRLANPPTSHAHSLRICPVNEVVVEAVLVYKAPDRIRTAALRLERERGTWRVNQMVLL